MQNWPTPQLTCSLPKRSLNKFVSRCEGLFYFTTVWKGRLREFAVITSWREIRSNSGRESCNSVCDPISYQDKKQGSSKEKLLRTDKPADETTLPGYFCLFAFQESLSMVCCFDTRVGSWGRGGEGGSTGDSSDRSADVLEYNSKLKC